MKTKEEILLAQMKRVHPIHIKLEQIFPKERLDLILAAMEDYAQESQLNPLASLGKELYAANVGKGFWNNRLDAVTLADSLEDKVLGKFIKHAVLSQMLMLMVSEVSEAMETLRDEDIPFLPDQKGLKEIMELDDKNFYAEFRRHKENFFMEIIDAIYRGLDISCGFQVDVDLLIRAKYRYNKLRGFKHGKTF